MGLGAGALLAFVCVNLGLLSSSCNQTPAMLMPPWTQAGFSVPVVPKPSCIGISWEEL